MKLIIATLTAATVIASAASAMTPLTQIDNRAAAQDAIGSVTTGVVSHVATDKYAFDGRSKALAGETVTITTFKTK